VPNRAAITLGATQTGRGGTPAPDLTFVYCLGCCWLLMCLLFVVGVMNLVWVAALTAFVLVEKIGPFGLAVARVTGAIMICFDILVIFGFP
jgi:predicted metal-binding membrane protein